MEESEPCYYYRLCTLLVDGSPKVLRPLLLQHADGDLDIFFRENQQEIMKLKLQQKQEDAILSIQSKKANINAMDITLLCTLLVRICKVEADLKTCINDLRKERNDVAHFPQASLTKQEFQSHWSITVDILKDLAHHVDDEALLDEFEKFCETVKTRPLDRTAKDRLLLEWEQYDTVVERLGVVEDKVRCLQEGLSERPAVSRNIANRMKMFLPNDTGTIFITHQIREADRLLESHNCLTLIGRPGEGKTCTMQYLVDRLITKGLVSLDKCALLYNQSELKYIDVERTDVIVLDDIFGKYNLEGHKLSKWKPVLEKLQDSVKNRKLYFILTSRKHIYQSVARFVRDLVMFDHVVDLSTDMVSDGDKESLFRHVLVQHKREMEDLDINRCIRSTASTIGFPYCVKQFATNDKFFGRKEQFFEKPYHYFKANLENMRKENEHQYLTMLYIFYQQNSLDEDGLHVRRMSETQREQLKTLSEIIGIEGTIPKLIKIVSEAVVSLLDVYLVFRNEKYSFTHDTSYEMLAMLHGEKYTEEVIDVCTVDFLCQCIATEEIKEKPERKSDECVLLVKPKYYKDLAQRMITEVTQRDNSPRIAKHQSLKTTQFSETFLTLLENSEDGPFRPFYTANVSYAISGIHGFLHHVLRNEDCNKDFVSGMLSQLQCRLESGRDHVTRACWQCKVKAEGMMGACAGGHYDIFRRLLSEGTEIRTICLYFVLGNPNAEIAFVQEVSSTLKAHNKLSPHDYCIAYAYALACFKEDEKFLRVLKENGVRLSAKSLYFFIERGDVNLVAEVVAELQSQQLWIVDDMQVARAFPMAQSLQDQSIFNLLSKKGMCFTTKCLFWAVFDHNYDIVKTIVAKLKADGNWNPADPFTISALFRSYILPDQRVRDCLLKAGVQISAAALWQVVDHGQSLDTIKDTIGQLQGAGEMDMDDYFYGLALVRARSQPSDAIYTHLRDKGVKVTSKCIYFAVKEHGVDVLKDIIMDIKDDNTWDPDDWYIARALVGTFAFQDSSIRQILVSEGTDINSKCIYWAVKDHPAHVLSIILDRLSEKDIVRDETYESFVSRAFVEATSLSIRDKKDMLLRHGAKINTSCIYWATVDQHHNVLIQILDDLDHDLLHKQQDDHCSRAVVYAISKCDDEQLNILYKAGLKVTLECFRWAVRDHDSATVEKIKARLEENDLWDPNHPDVSKYLLNKPMP